MPKRIAGEAPGGFGERLARLRKQAGLSQTALARVLGFSVETQLGTETAKRKSKAIDTRMQRRSSAAPPRASALTNDSASAPRRAPEGDRHD